jgi:hypothetical protein
MLLSPFACFDVSGFISNNVAALGGAQTKLKSLCFQSCSGFGLLALHGLKVSIKVRFFVA